MQAELIIDNGLSLPSNGRSVESNGLTAELLLFHGMLRPPWVSNPPSKPRYEQDSLPNTYYNELPWSMLPLHTRRTHPVRAHWGRLRGSVGGCTPQHL